MGGRARTAVLIAIGLLLGAGAVAALTAGMRRGTAVAASVNGEVIYQRELDAEVDAIARQYGIDASTPDGRRQRREIARIVLDQLIDQRLILQQARLHNALPTEADVDAQVAEIRRTFPTDADFEAALAQRRLTLADLRSRLRSSLAVRRLLTRVAPVTVSEDEVVRYFREHRGEFDRPEQVRVRHILLDDQRVAELVLGRLRRGELFDALARQYSRDADSRERGGDLGWVSRGQLVPEFEQVAFSLQPGQVSGVVRTQYGYHIIQLLERRPPVAATLDQVREQVRQRLLASKQEAAFQQWLQTVRAQARIVRTDRPTE
ncbi:MAG: peptidylprolyl isomerase [Armatimonadota bacterium]|nr:peptidylprolyl isomerase [Armatimonadota bacterium]MDR7401694.1 peptidylprolyl isomerase [Armatimonadota bacterium]MDR7403756.1 peptidylprolyl isomerase [Armatimonadota bacterium]MDR7436296.1 peptidylprolyl isomerase [Armatimonadota bacterium]MDR7471324.1 peptidylprolyl isomerase [Armatimonadota bacterium]